MQHLIHPDILQAIARNGHGAKILITDVNYPVGTCTPASAIKVFLNLYMDCITVTDVLRVLLHAVQVESAMAMELPAALDTGFHQDYQSLLGDAIPFEKLPKQAFYLHSDSKDNCLTIVTGDSRRGSNLLLVLGLKVNKNRP